MLRSLLTSELCLLDLSSLPRAGIKGKDISQWIKSQSYTVGAKSNNCYEQRDGMLIARLSPGELLLLTNPANPSLLNTIHSVEMTYKCYPVRRQDSHYWFAAIGTRSPEMFAKLSGVDLSHNFFNDHSVAQTSVAQTSAVIVRRDIVDVPCYYLLGDSSTALYMWTCLVDAIREFDGQVLEPRALENITGLAGD